jgi:hypothetical protein
MQRSTQRKDRAEGGTEGVAQYHGRPSPRGGTRHKL